MNSRQMSLCGLLSALAVVLLLSGSLIPLATFAAPLLAMIVLLPILLEYGPRAAGTAYGAVSILALLLTTDRELALVFAAFGWYPLLRGKLKKVPSRPLQLVIQLALCNLVIALLYGVVMRLLGMTSAMADSTRWINILTLLLANIVFLLLDKVLDRMTLLWQHKFRKRFLK